MDSTFYKYNDMLSEKLPELRLSFMDRVANLSLNFSLLLFMLCGLLVSFLLIGYYTRPDERAKKSFLESSFVQKTKMRSGKFFIWALVFLLVSFYIKHENLMR